MRCISKSYNGRLVFKLKSHEFPPVAILAQAFDIMLENFDVLTRPSNVWEDGDATVALHITACAEKF